MMRQLGVTQNLRAVTDDTGDCVAYNGKGDLLHICSARRHLRESWGGRGGGIREMDQYITLTGNTTSVYCCSV